MRTASPTRNESDSKYPYTDDGNREFLEGKEFIETFALIGALVRGDDASCSFTPFVLKLPIRPPVLVAKQAGSLAAMFDNRLGLGVGTSPWPEDFEIMGVPWAKRGKRMDECIDILRGPHLRRLLRLPRRVLRLPQDQDDARADRAGARSSSAATPTPRCGAPCCNDGWMHAGGDREELDRLLARLHEIRKEEGDDPRRLRGPRHLLDAYTLDGIKRLEDKGVTDCIVGFRVPYIKGPDTEPLDDKIRNLERFAENVIAKV